MSTPWTQLRKKIRAKHSKGKNMAIKILRNYSLQDVVNNGHDLLQMAHDVFDSAHKILEKPTTWNIAKESMKIAQVLLTREIPGASDYFWGGWDTVFPTEMSLILLELLRDHEFRTIKTSDKTSMVRIVDIDGCEFGWIAEEGKMGADDIWCREEDTNKAKSIICELLWKKFGDKPLLVRKARGKDFEGKIELEIDDKIPPLRSKKAENMAEYLKRCFAAGVNRSQLYYGPPGTGKSTLVRMVAHLLNLRTLRIRVEDIADLDSSLVHEIIQIFKPDSIIMDDLDRAPMIHHLLEMMDDLKRTVKLLAATVNDKSELGDAMLRPGRFDELHEFKHLEEEVIRAELGPENNHLYDGVKHWPIVYVQELVIRRKFMNETDAVASMKELQARVKELDKYGLWATSDDVADGSIDVDMDDDEDEDDDD
jgi:hypothetical protein